MVRDTIIDLAQNDIINWFCGNITSVQYFAYCIEAIVCSISYFTELPKIYDCFFCRLISGLC